MTGVDLSEEFIVEARGSSPLPIEWVAGDMCELPWASEFDGAYCFGNSFGYLDSDGARTFFSAVAGALKPGGRFAIETGMAAESILPGLLQKRWHRLGDLFMLSENQYHPAEGRLDIQYAFIRDSVVDKRPTSSWINRRRTVSARFSAVDFGCWSWAQKVNRIEPCITLAARVVMTVPKRAFV